MAKFFYAPSYTLHWPGHVFPTAKYKAVHDRIAQTMLAADGIHIPEPATNAQLRLVHTTEYLERLQNYFRNPQAAVAELEAPMTQEIFNAYLAMTGGTIAAARAALEHRGAMNLGGGFHHAFADRGAGFCAINDIAVAIRVLQQDNLIRRPAVIDCDVHQGDGTARIFETDPDVFTYSIHQENNYPAKQRSSLDHGLDDRTGDAEYLRVLQQGLATVFSRHRPDLVIYVAGADPYQYDVLGGLALTLDGLAARDTAVFSLCRDHKTPVAVVLAGGYPQQFEDGVEIHYNTARLLQLTVD